MDKIQEEIIEEFSVFDDWLDKYDYLIGLSDSLPAIPAEHRTEQYLIEGCQSRVWVDARMPIFISIIIASLGFIVTIIVQKITSKNSDEPVLEEIDEDNDIDDADKENIESDVTEVEESKGFYLAFGPYIAIGTIIYICFFNLINNAVSMYLALFK